MPRKLYPTLARTIGSRPDAERWILEGRVSVNGRVIRNLQFRLVKGDSVSCPALVFNV